MTTLLTWTFFGTSFEALGTRYKVQHNAQYIMHTNKIDHTWAHDYVMLLPNSIMTYFSFDITHMISKKLKIWPMLQLCWAPQQTIYTFLKMSSVIPAENWILDIGFSKKFQVPLKFFPLAIVYIIQTCMSQTCIFLNIQFPALQDIRSKIGYSLWSSISHTQVTYPAQNRISCSKWDILWVNGIFLPSSSDIDKTDILPQTLKNQTFRSQQDIRGRILDISLKFTGNLSCSKWDIIWQNGI